MVLNAGMKKLLVLLSVVALSYALQAGDSECPLAKGKCDKANAGGCEMGKKSTSGKVKVEEKSCCPAAGKAQDGGKKVQDAGKKPIVSPKASS